MKVQLKKNKCSKKEAFEILHKYLMQEKELMRRKSISEDTFKTPDWAMYQAYTAGMQRAYDKVSSFIPDQGDIIE